MAQTIQILRTTTNVAPTTLLPGALSAELGPQTKLWIGSGSGNRLLLSSDPADSGAAGGAYLKLAGGTLTGALTLAADPSLALGAATKQYTDTKDALRLLLTGGTLTGPLTLAADPAAALQPATKQYVDAINTTLAAADTTIRGTYLPLVGGTLTGPLTLAADPAAPLQAATRQYVDAKPSGATILAVAPASPTPGQLWWDSVGGQLYVYYNDGTSQQWVTVSTVPGLSVPVAIAQGGTGAVTAPAALTALGAQPKAGTTTNDNAAAGQIGEYVTVSLPQGTPQNIGGAAWFPIMSMNLSPGDWDVWGELWFQIDNGTTVSAIGAFINQSAVTAPASTVAESQSGNWFYASAGGTFPTSAALTCPMAPFRMSIAVTTPAMVWSYAIISAGSPIHIYGKLCARRRR